MSRIKILFCIDSFASGGKERRLMELMKGLKYRNEIEFSLVIMSAEIHFKELFELNIPVHQMVRKTKKDLSIFKKFYDLCKTIQPDIIHCWDSMSAIYAIPAILGLKIKLVNGMITDAPSKLFLLNQYWYRAQLTFLFSKRIIANSMAGLHAYNAPLNKSTCIPNGFNFKRIQNLRSADALKKNLNINNELIVGMVASFSHYKDYPTYFAAAQLILEQRKDVIFLAVGTDTDSAKAKTLIEDKYLSNFRLLGKNNEVESVVNIMDIGVLATFTEGISNSILEYMALGKPVIATEGGGTKEIVKDNVTGFLVPSKNVNELSLKIQILLNDKELRESMGEKGASEIHKNFSLNSMVDHFVNAYSELVNGKLKSFPILNNQFP